MWEQVWSHMQKRGTFSDNEVKIIESCTKYHQAKAAQLRGIAEAMVYAKHHYMDGRRSLREIIDRVMADIEAAGLGSIAPFPSGDLAMFRPFELAAAIDRLRTLQIVSTPRPTPI